MSEQSLVLIGGGLVLLWLGCIAWGQPRAMNRIWYWHRSISGLHEPPENFYAQAHARLHEGVKVRQLPLRGLGFGPTQLFETRSIRGQRPLYLEARYKDSTLYLFTLQQPAAWTVSMETEGRYRKTHFRSGSPYIHVLVEKGERSTPATVSTIDWRGMERGFRRHYKSNYRPIRMGEGLLGGEAAGLWLFDLQRPSEPRLRKLYLGLSRTWDSQVIVCTAPARDFKQWQPVFEQVIQGFAFR